MLNESNNYTAASNAVAHSVSIHARAKESDNPYKYRNISGDQYQSIGEPSGNRILNTLPDGELNRLLPYLQPVSFAAGDNVLQPDEGANHIYFPETAVFSQVNFLEDGRTAETMIIGNEGLIGISSVLSRHKPTTLWTQTVIGGSALRINCSIICQEFARGGVLQNAFFEYLNVYIRQISQKAVCNQHHLIEEKFCAWLLTVDDRRATNKIFITHEQIAYFLGVHRPSVTGVAQKLRDLGIIKYSRGNLVIVNRQSLEERACECYALMKS